MHTAVLCDLRRSLNLSEPAGELVWASALSAASPRPSLLCPPWPSGIPSPAQPLRQPSRLVPLRQRPVAGTWQPPESATDLHQRLPTWGQSDRLRVHPPSPSGCGQVWACPRGHCQADGGQADSHGPLPRTQRLVQGRHHLGLGGVVGRAGSGFLAPPHHGRTGAPAVPGPGLVEPLGSGSWAWTLLGEETLGTKTGLSGHRVRAPGPWTSPVMGKPPCSDPTPVTASQPWPEVASWGPNCFCV